MKAIRVHGPDEFHLDEIPEPAAGPGDIVVRVAACGICGSDMTYIATGGVAAPATEPFGLGHELSGVIETVGGEVADLVPGMRVIINPMGNGNAIGNGAPEGAFAPRLLVRNASRGDSVHPIPDDLPFERAALAEPLSVGMHAVNRAAPEAKDKVAIFGGGPIGLGVLLFLRRRGIDDVIVIDMADQRLDRARNLGAAATINPSQEDVAEALGRHHGTDSLFGWPVIGTNRFFEVSGAASVIPDIVAMAPFHAQLAVVAVHAEPVPINFQMVLGKEMTITTSMAYTNEFPAVLEALNDPDFDVAHLTSHRFQLDDFSEAFATARDTSTSSKVLVTFDATGSEHG